MLVHWIWLANRQGLREKIAAELVRTFLDIEAIYIAGEDDYRRVPDIRAKEIEVLCDKSTDHAERIITTCRMYGIHMVSFCDAAYPERLRNISDPPMVLYYKGCLPAFDNEAAIGIVGTRKPSVYGCKIAQTMGFHISRCGGLVVSGMAVGIDSMATNGALLSGNSAVGVLACGVDVEYPAGSRDIRRELESRGCILSEYPPGTRPSPQIFPKRNRLISGLSCGVLVVEAPERSGALITARHAIEQGRDVFAIPGNIDSYCSAGCNALIANGARSVRYAWDLMQEYETLFPNKVHHWAGGVDLAEALKGSVGPEWLAERVYISPIRDPAAGPQTVTFAAPEDKGIDKSEKTTYIEKKAPRELPADLTEEEQTVVKVLTSELKQVDQIIVDSGLQANQVLAALTLLEMKGLVVRHPGKHYSLPD